MTGHGRMTIAHPGVGGALADLTPERVGMTHGTRRIDQVGHGEASLGDAQSSNPPDDDDMIFPDVPPLDADTDFEEDEDPPPQEPLDNDDPAPNIP